jgi:hypothetical protein
MKAEHKEMLDKVVEVFLWYGLHFSEKEDIPLSEEEFKRRDGMFDALIESGDSEVLCGLIGMLTTEAGKGGGGSLDEYFPQKIFSHYTKEQIAEAVFDHFDAIYDSEEWENKLVVEGVLEDICSMIWGHGLTEEDFQMFRRLFNKTRPRNAERFLNKMEEAKSKYDGPMIATLREDMKKWGDKSATEE